MTVQDLRETLTQLAGLLAAADAKQGTIKGLTEFVEATSSFGDLSLKAFVKLAEAGRTPPAPKPPPVPRRTGVKASVDPDAITAEVNDLYDRAADASVTEAQVREACGRLSPLTKDALARLAEGVGLYGMKTRTKGDIIREVTNRLLERKADAVRRQLIDRPKAPDAGRDGHPITEQPTAPV